jgi:hypothetical protein
MLAGASDSRLRYQNGTARQGTGEKSSRPSRILISPVHPIESTALSCILSWRQCWRRRTGHGSGHPNVVTSTSFDPSISDTSSTARTPILPMLAQAREE